ncbi:MAG: energy-coupling factor transporter transmembrane component T [Thermodesulfovibrionales bacterium]
MSPEIRIILYTIFVICLFFIKDPAAYLFILSSILLVIIILRVSFRVLKSGWVPISLLLLFTFISNALFQHGKIWYQTGPLIITDEGLNIAFIRTMRVLLMIAGAKILTATTTPDSLANALGTFLRPLSRLKMPVDDLLHIMGLTLKSLPRLKKEIVGNYREKISRENINGFRDHVRVISTQLVPIFIMCMQVPERYFKEEIVNKTFSTTGTNEFISKSKPPHPNPLPPGERESNVPPPLRGGD